MVVALLALFIALGGPAQAKKVLDGNLLKRNSVTGKVIKNGSVAKADLSKAAVKSLERTPENSVRSAQIVDGQVLAPDLGAGAVTSTALAAGSVTSSKLAADSIGGGSVANGSLQTVDIGSFAGAVSVSDFLPFSTGSPCQKFPAHATPTGGQPNITDDVIVVTAPFSFPDTVIVTGKPGDEPGEIQVVACWSGQGAIPTPGPTIFRYVTFDSP
jgi:hypothetical protein